MADFVRYYVGDVVQMKKAHPCGCNEWEVLRIGVDFVIRCTGLRSPGHDPQTEV